MNLRQFGRALCLDLRGVVRGFGTRQRRMRTVGIGAICRIVNLIQRLPSLDQRALNEQALLHNARHLRSHFGHQ